MHSRQGTELEGFIEPFPVCWHKQGVDEEQLVSALRSRHPEEWARLVDSLGDRLLRSAFLLCGDATEAQDLVQETFLKALRAAPQFRGHSSVYTWLHGILLNLSRHYHRDSKRIFYDDELAAGQNATASEEGPLESDFEAVSCALQKGLRRLPGPLREILILRFYEEMKIEEIARHLGLATGTVKSRLHYALKHMQNLLPTEMNLFGCQGTEIRKDK
jgi:RNA polymerase sigma-70 factor (ECF subfamily)